MLFTVTTQEKKIAQELTGQGADVEMKHLLTGDVCFTAKNKLIGAEIKSAADLVSAFVGKQKNGKSRLFNQMTRMLETFDESILLVWDVMWPTPEWKVAHAERVTGVPWDALWGALHHWQKQGIILEPVCQDRRHVARRLIMLAKSHARA